MITEPNNLRLAFVRARRGKTAHAEVLAFADRLHEELAAIRKELLQVSLRPAVYRSFVIYEPKRREICAGSFRTNVLHHAIMNICHADFERRQVFDAYACRVGKGTHAAVRRAQQFSRRFAWYLQLDVQDFFATIEHEVLKAQLGRVFKDEQLLAILRQIIDSYEVYPKRGVPLGNLTSQYFANHYMQPLDRYIKQELRCPAYVRYMDDFVLWHPNKDWLKEAKNRIQGFVDNELRCQLKPAILQTTNHGLSFLGYRIFPHSIRLTAKRRYRNRRKLRAINQAWLMGDLTDKEAQRSVQSLMAYAHYFD